jgi:hypothetical protein
MVPEKSLHCLLYRIPSLPLSASIAMCVADGLHPAMPGCDLKCYETTTSRKKR